MHICEAPVLLWGRNLLHRPWHQCSPSGVTQPTKDFLLRTGVFKFSHVPAPVLGNRLKKKNCKADLFSCDLYILEGLYPRPNWLPQLPRLNVPHCSACSMVLQHVAWFFISNSQLPDFSSLPRCSFLSIVPVNSSSTCLCPTSSHQQ